jgi:hypothetical protein
MQVKRSQNVQAAPVHGMPGVTIRWLWSESDGALTFALRLFEVAPGAARHPWTTRPTGHGMLFAPATGFSLSHVYR